MKYLDFVPLAMALFLQKGKGSTLRSTPPPETCCELKQVGTVNYTLVDEAQAPVQNCLDGCIYISDDDSNHEQKYCFKVGELPHECFQTETGIWTTTPPLYNETLPGTPTSILMDTTTGSPTASPAPTTGPGTCTGDVPAKPVVVSSKPYDSRFPATSLFTLEEDIYTSPTKTFTYFLTPNSYRGVAFIVDLGSCVTITGIRLKNTHNGGSKDRATKKFALFGAMSSDGPWSKLMEQSLEDSRQQASPPVQKFELGKEAEVRFIKFVMLDYWGAGGGLQYFAAFTADNGTPTSIPTDTTTGSPTASPAPTTGLDGGGAQCSKLIKTGPFGPEKGVDWSDEAAFKANGPISGMNVAYGSIMDSIQAIYGGVPGRKHGGDGGLKKSFILPPNATINSVSGTFTSTHFTAIKFADSEGNTYGPYKGYVGGDHKPWSAPGRPDCKLLYLSAKSSNYLWQLSLWWGCPCTTSTTPTTSVEIDTCTGDVPAKPVVVSSKPYNSAFPATNMFTLGPRFLTPNSYRGDAFTLDLGSCTTIAGIRLKNTHNGGSKDRATKKFALHGAMTSDGPWTKLMEQGLEDARHQASPPVQRFELGKGAEVRFIKFEMLDYWGPYGGGLQYFAPFTAAEN